MIGGRSRAPWVAGALIVTAFAAWLPLWPSLAPLFSPSSYEAIVEPRILRVLGRTAGMSLIAAIVSMLIGGFLAVVAGRLATPGARAIELLIPLPLFLPPLLLASGWYGLTGWDGLYAAAFTLGTVYAPFPALLGIRALRKQSRSAHDAACLVHSRLALGEMLRVAAPAIALGGALSFLFSATDFAVPDYFGFVGEPFDVYANIVFNAWRDFTQLDATAASLASLESGAAASAPLVVLIAAAFYLALKARDRYSAEDSSSTVPPDRLPLAGSRWPLAFGALVAIGLTLLIPLGRVVFETGSAGPLAEGSWWSRSGEAFSQAVERGRADLARSLGTGAMAAVIVAATGPVWAHLLLSAGTGARRRLTEVLLALPLLAPAVGIGIGAILLFNRDLFGSLYDSRLLPALLCAGRLLPIAVFLLHERMQRVPAAQLESAELAGISYYKRLFRVLIGPHRATWLLAAGLVAVFTVRELDLAILLPAANASAAVRYYNALHFARDNFVAAFGLLIALVLFLPVMLHAAWQGLRPGTHR